MKISELIGRLSVEMERSGDIQVVIPLDTGDYAMVVQAEVDALFLHMVGLDPVYSSSPGRGQAPQGHEHVAILRWD